VTHFLADRCSNCGRGAVAYVDGVNLCTRHLDERETALDFLGWLEGLADGSVLFTRRYAGKAR
jgi:hypothetical protein